MSSPKKSPAKGTKAIPAACRLKLGTTAHLRPHRSMIIPARKKKAASMAADALTITPICATSRPRTSAA